MGGGVGEVLFETRYHAKGGGRLSASCFSPQLVQIDGGVRAGLLSRLSVGGLYKLKEVWAEYRRPKTSKKKISLFISPNGEHVAIALENQITILQEEDKYMTPCGIFTSTDRSTIFKGGTWLEPAGILGVIDNMDTLYIIKSNGEEISRTTSRQLKLPLSISGLIALDDFNAEHSMNGFCIVTADGSLYCIEVTQEPRACIYSSSVSQLRPKASSSESVSCLDFCQDLSLLVMVYDSTASLGSSVENSGFYSICLWHVARNLELSLLFSSPNFEGLYSSPKSHLGIFTTPKVLISPEAKHVATLDMNGSLHIYKLKQNPYSLSIISFDSKCCLEFSDNSELVTRNCLTNIVDFTWWSNHSLILSMGGCHVAMLDVDSGLKDMGNDPEFSVSLLERVNGRQGYVFALNCRLAQENSVMSEHKETSEHVPHENYERTDTGGSSWSLISLSAKSVSEMYAILIQKQQYQTALEFANRFQLNEEEIFKSQWLRSDQGVDEINKYLSNINDQNFVLSECLKVGSAEDTVMALLSLGLCITDQYKFLSLEDETDSVAWKYRMIRLQLVQYKDRLETFLGINMGRFSVQEYGKFRTLPINVSAIALAESGKIGALNLLFKRHPYSLAGNILDILGAIPETVPVHSYGQLLPGSCPPSAVILRDKDWVECEKMVSFINDTPIGFKTKFDTKTEIILKYTLGLVWPSTAELSEWYKNRARDIDNLSGQLDNSLSLVDFACCKGMIELKPFLEDITYLHQLIYCNDEETTFFMSLDSWEELSDYEKFKMMLKEVKEDKVVARLREKAIPFMHNRACSKEDLKHVASGSQPYEVSESVESFLVSWLKEIAAKNEIGICLVVIEEGCWNLQAGKMFGDEVEAVNTALECLYSCTLTDCWNIMASILSKLPRKTQKEISAMHGNVSSPRHGIRGFGSPISSYWDNQRISSETSTDILSWDKETSLSQDSVGNLNGTKVGLTENLEKRIKVAEGHVEVGRLLAYYQVPKPMSFFQGAHSDEKNVKQLIRLVLSKFSRQPGRSDNDWANMWRDLQCFQARAFPFLDKEYMLAEFCRGLLKAGKFSLARSYLKGSGDISLTTEKAENLVIQAAREYFFSASSLACSEIWKAKECLNLFPNSESVNAESDVINVLTNKLPNYGVTLLPVQYKQIRNPMEIINTVITSQTGAYLDVDGLIEIAKLLGLRSPDDTAAIQEAVAREAAVAGDLQLAFDLCLVLAKKGHGPIWDLASAIARGPVLENMDIISRRQLLGFALSHCDNESIDELLHAWKNIDMQIHTEKLMMLTATSPPSFSIPDFSNILPLAQKLKDNCGVRVSVEGDVDKGKNVDVEVHLRNISNMLSKVAKKSPTEDGDIWDDILRENGKLFSFVASQLPWLLELSGKAEYGKKASVGDKTPEKWCMPVTLQAGLCILSWLAVNSLAPNDDLIASLANSVMEPPVTSEEDVIGCSFLLNLMDAFHGVKIIEEQRKTRENYREVHSIMKLGMMYSSLQSSACECSSPSQRRVLLLHRFQEKHESSIAGQLAKMDEVQSTFWREWKLKLEEQKRLADHAKELEGVIPGVDTSRFLSGDISYIEGAILQFIDTVKLEKKHIIKDAVKLADAHGVERKKVLLRYLGCALVSEHWTNDEILVEISDFKDDIVTSARDIVSMLCLVVYPEVEGHNKLRLSYIYSILSACYLHLKKTEGPALLANKDLDHAHNLELFHYYRVLDQECRRISFIKELNFKRIAGLIDLNFECFNEEVCKHICESTAHALADMVKILSSLYKDPQSKGLISWQAVYNHHIIRTLTDLETASKARLQFINSDNFLAFVSEIEKNYEGCTVYIRALPEEERLHIYRKYYTLCVPSIFSGDLPDESGVKSCLVGALDFWIRLTDNIQESMSGEMPEGTTGSFNGSSLSNCFKVLRKLVMGGTISANKGWSTVSDYVRHCLTNPLSEDRFSLCKSMIFSGCGFKEIAKVFSEGKSTNSNLNISQDLLQLYVGATDSSLNDLINGPGNRRNLHMLLSSLSKLRCNSLEELKDIRCAIWERLSAFSDDMQLPSHIRVYALELLESVTGRNHHSNSVEFLSDIESWEGWDEPSNENATSEQGDMPSKLTSTLIALKSTELASLISPSFKITSVDLSTVESTVSCFLHLSEASISKQHVDRLQVILEVWEELFHSLKEDQFCDMIEEKNDWSGDDWGDEWENLPDEPVKNPDKADVSASVHPLHTCWMEIIRKLIKLSQLAAVTELLDRSLSRSKFVILSVNEAQELLQLLIPIDCFIALKVVLLLPYQALWFQSLIIIEDKLNLEGFQSKSGGELELLVVVLSSGILPSIIKDPAYCKTFSYLCFSVGHLSQLCQDDLLKHRRDRSITSRNAAFLFSGLALPCFVAELVLAGQYLLAGHIVSQWMHTHPSLSLINVAEVSLRTYLDRSHQKQQGGYSDLAEMTSSGFLVHTCSNLRIKLGNSLQSSLLALQTNMN